MPTKEELLDLYINEVQTMEQIGIKFAVSTKTVRKWFKQYNIISKGFIRNSPRPPKEELISEYTTKTNSIKDLAKKYGVGERSVKRWFQEYSIKPIRSVERKYYHLRKVPFTKKQREFIIGSLLGDGHIDNGKLKRFAVNHSDKQLDYIMYKKEVLNNFINMVRKNKPQKKRKSVAYNLTTIGHQEFNFYHKLFYDNTKKVIRKGIENYLTPYVMAIWVMDDGHTRKYDMKLCTEGFTKKENEILRNAIYVRFGIGCNVSEYNNRGKKYYILTFNKKNSLKLCDLIKPYIISSMQYKLLRSSTTER